MTTTPNPATETVTADANLIAELRALLAELDQDRVLPGGTWTASPLDDKSTLPPGSAQPPEDVKQYVVEDQLRTPSGNALIRGSVGIFGNERHARFTALAHQALPALLAEIERLSRPSYSERHVWQVWNEHDSSTHALYATEDDAKTGTIECWEEVEESCPDYSWQPARGDHSLELLVGGEPAGIYLTRQDVHGKAVAQ